MKAWLEGSWDIVSGGIFGDVWLEEFNVLPAFRIPHSWFITRSFDWGSSAPFSVGWWAESDGSDIQTMDGSWKSTVRGDQFRIHEWYGWNGEPNTGLQMLDQDIAKGIIELELEWGIYGNVEVGPADSSIFDVESGESIADRMSEEVRIGDEWYDGVEWIPADKRSGSRVVGWEAIRLMMRNAHPPEKGPREKPGLFVFNNCDQFLRTVPNLPRDEKKIEDVDTRVEDHIGDETRYYIRTLGNTVSFGKTSGGY